MNKITDHSLIAKASRGFTLLEALIALLVLSIGLLGLAGLQASSARLGHEAHMRSITTVAASEIIEKIRVRTAKLSRADRPDIVQQYVGAGGDCDPTESSIDNDVACWQENLALQLPEGQGAIADDDGDGIFDVEISWYDRETEQLSTISWSFVAGQ
jgi:type IV pilus assembly protein PilV